MLDHRGTEDTEVGPGESLAASRIANFIGMRFFMSMQECSVTFFSVSSMPRW